MTIAFGRASKNILRENKVIAIDIVCSLLIFTFAAWQRQKKK